MAKDKKNIHAGHRKRMKESVQKDPELASFSDIEVLEYLLSFFIPRKDTNPIAHDLIDRFGSLYGVFNANKDELFQSENMTSGAATLIPNLASILRRVELSRVKNRNYLRRIDDAVEAMRPFFRYRHGERLYMMSIDTNDKLMQIDLVSVGVSNYTVLDFNKLLGIASRNMPSKVILAHNHPAGNLSPSNDDIGSTKSISLVLSTIGVRLVDHIIFTDDGYYSFYDNDIMLDCYMQTDNLLGSNFYQEVRARKDSGKYVLEARDMSDGVAEQRTKENRHYFTYEEDANSADAEGCDNEDDKAENKAAAAGERSGGV